MPNVMYPANPAGYSGPCEIFWSRTAPQNAGKSSTYPVEAVVSHRYKNAKKLDNVGKLRIQRFATKV